jgi:ABC-type sugar transport system ATPase subunit
MATDITEAAPLLRVRNVGKTYGRVQALRSASMTITPGEVVAIVGENGAGKSTFVKILSGLITATTGSIEISGRDLSSDWNPKKSVDSGIAVVQQELSIIPTLTVAENLLVSDDHSGIWWRARERQEAAAQLLEQVGLGDLDPGTVAGTLPVSTQQLVEIARTLARDARLIVMDEPTASMGDEEITRVKRVVRRLVATGRSVVYVSHRLEEILEIADRIVVFRDGASQEPVTPQEVSDGQLVERMIGRPVDDLYPAPRAVTSSVSIRISDVACAALQQPVSIDLRRGEILGVAGQTGSGASAFLRLLGGSADDASGSIEIDGRRCGLRSRRDALRHRIAYCSPDRKKDGMFAELTVAQNISAPALRKVSRLGVLNGSSERAKSASMAAKFTIPSDRMNHRVGALSGGNQQKVVLAKWLSIDPVLLIVDEPTRGVDVGARAEIYAVLRNLAEEGMTVVVGSSDIHEVQGLADRVLTFYRGAVVAVHDANDVTAGDLLAEVTHPHSGRQAERQWTL